MRIEFDPRKDATNRKKHGISLKRAADLDLSTAYFAPDLSQDYGEDRFIVIGWLDTKLYTLIVTFGPDMLRAISLRKSKPSEQAIYAENS